MLAVFGALFALAATGAHAAIDKPAKQAEIDKAVQVSLDKFYKARPSIKADVQGAPGYAVFTTYGLSFLIGGSGGSGVAHHKDGKRTYMNMAQASAGMQAGIGGRDMLVIFRTQKALDNFVAKGWEAGGGGQAAAGVGGKSAGGGVGEQYIADADYYTLTKTGLEVGAALAGTKFWKDKDLN